MRITGKGIKLISWVVCFSLALVLLAGGTLAYDKPDQGFNMPAILDSHEKIDWPKINKEGNKIDTFKNIDRAKDKIKIFKRDMPYPRQGVCIGRGPPSNIYNL